MGKKKKKASMAPGHKTSAEINADLESIEKQNGSIQKQVSRFCARLDRIRHLLARI